LHVGAHNVTSVDIYYNAGHPGVEARTPCRTFSRRRSPRASGRVMLTRRQILAAGVAVSLPSLRRPCCVRNRLK
ncbi:hypothetical protein ACLGGT_20705, partial [Roseovarius sp. MS2]